MSLQTPLARVLGKGSAKEGSGHWWTQRVTSVALIVLTLWFVAALIGLPDLNYDAVYAWVGTPVNAVLLVLLIVTMAYHSQLGVQVVVEDYVADKATKLVVLLVSNFLHVALGALGIFSVLRIAFGAAA